MILIFFLKQTVISSWKGTGKCIITPLKFCGITWNWKIQVFPSIIWDRLPVIIALWISAFGCIYCLYVYCLVSFYASFWKSYEKVCLEKNYFVSRLLGHPVHCGSLRSLKKLLGKFANILFALGPIFLHQNSDLAFFQNWELEMSYFHSALLEAQKISIVVVRARCIDVINLLPILIIFFSAHANPPKISVPKTSNYQLNFGLRKTIGRKITADKTLVEIVNHHLSFSSMPNNDKFFFYLLQIGKMRKY